MVSESLVLIGIENDCISVNNIVTNVNIGILLLMLLLMLPFASCQGETTAPLTAGFTTYTDPAGYFSISYPADWQAFPPWYSDAERFFFLNPNYHTAATGLIFYAAHETEAEKTYLYLRVTNTTFYQKAGRFTLTEMIASIDEVTPEGGEPRQELSRDTATIAGREAIVRSLRWGWDWSGKRIFVQSYLVEDGLLWELTYSIDKGDNERLRDEALAVVKSLNFIPGSYNEIGRKVCEDSGLAP